ncbi:unnamed protein product, partial [Ilex paraguariensis]
IMTAPPRPSTSKRLRTSTQEAPVDRTFDVSRFQSIKAKDRYVKNYEVKALVSDRDIEYDNFACFGVNAIIMRG